VPGQSGQALPDPRGVPEERPTDGDLLRRHVSGDKDAFGLLFLRHRDRLWAVALRTLADADEAADALQDAMISAFRRAGDFRGDSAVTTWLHRIVVNACLDRLRRKAARPATSGMDERTLDALAAGAASPHHADHAADTETSLDVLAALRTLAYEQRAALVLVDMLGYSVADAAEVLGVSTGTVKSRCARGRARLLPRLAHLRGAPRADHGAATQTQPAQTQPAQTQPAQTQAARNQPASPRVSAGEGGDSQA
jgi:RNA polymerase sigma-70 factor, ECF subfamily